MVHWLVTVLIGLALAVGGALLAGYTANMPNASYVSEAGWGVGIVGIIVIGLGIWTKYKSLN